MLKKKVIKKKATTRTKKGNWSLFGIGKKKVVGHKKGRVFAVPKTETAVGYRGYHVVHYSPTGDLNKGKTKKFKSWTDAKSFAKTKAAEYKVKPMIHPY